MRVVQMVLTLDTGGQERMILHLSRALSRRGHDLHVVVLSDGGDLLPEFAPLPVHAVPRAGRSLLSLPLRLARVLAGIRPDVVHTHNAAPLVFGVPAARLARVPVVVHTSHNNNHYSRLTGPLSRLSARLVTRFVAVSQATAELSATLERPPADRLVVVENGIPLGDFAAARARRQEVRAALGLGPEVFAVGAVGRLVSEKDYPFLVRALSPALGPRLRLFLVGEGPERGAIEAAIPEAARPHVTLLGRRTDVAALLAAFDLFALSSRTEGLPLVVPEAYAAGLPVVATAVGGLPSIISAETGALVPHGDERALREAILALAHDPARRQQAATAAAALAEARFSVEAMASAYEALYR